MGTPASATATNAGFIALLARVDGLPGDARKAMFSMSGCPSTESTLRPGTAARARLALWASSVGTRN